MAVNETNDELVDMLGAFFVRNDGELHLSVASTAVTPYAANKASVILVTTGALAFTVNLPVAANCYGKVYCVKKVDAGAGAVRVTPNAGAGDTIDGALFAALANQWQAMIIVCDGVNAWYRISLT